MLSRRGRARPGDVRGGSRRLRVHADAGLVSWVLMATRLILKGGTRKQALVIQVLIFVYVWWTHAPAAFRATTDMQWVLHIGFCAFVTFTLLWTFFRWHPPTPPR